MENTPNDGTRTSGSSLKLREETTQKAVVVDLV